MSSQYPYDVVSLFPTPIYVAEFNKEIDQEIIKFIHDEKQYSLYENSYGILTGSDRFDLIHLPVFRSIKNFIVENIKNYSKNIMCIDNEIFPTISWLNRTTTGAYHYQHHHVNSIISGVFYLTDDPAPIEFHTEKNCIWNPLKMFPFKFNEFNTWSASFEVKKGHLLLFPSYLDHSVLRTTGNNDRISLAFNTWIKGTIGMLDNTSYLNLDDPKLELEKPENLNVVIERQKKQKL